MQPHLDSTSAVAGLLQLSQSGSGTEILGNEQKKAGSSNTQSLTTSPVLPRASPQAAGDRFATVPLASSPIVDTSMLPPSRCWNDMFVRLQDFYARRGRGAQPSTASPLGAWTTSQRAERRKGTLLPEHEAKLNEIGFEWAPHWSGVTWSQRYGQLVEYVRVHGHCRVRYSGGGLGGWVSTQRRAKKGGKLSRERMEKLDKLGFVWDARPDSEARAAIEVVNPVSSNRRHLPPQTAQVPLLQFVSSDITRPMNGSAAKARAYKHYNSMEEANLCASDGAKSGAIREPAVHMASRPSEDKSETKFRARRSVQFPVISAEKINSSYKKEKSVDNDDDEFNLGTPVTPAGYPMQEASSESYGSYVVLPVKKRSRSEFEDAVDQHGSSLRSRGRPYGQDRLGTSKSETLPPKKAKTDSWLCPQDSNKCSSVKIAGINLQPSSQRYKGHERASIPLRTETSKYENCSRESPEDAIRSYRNKAEGRGSSRNANAIAGACTLATLLPISHLISPPQPETESQFMTPPHGQSAGSDIDVIELDTIRKSGTKLLD